VVCHGAYDGFVGGGSLVCRCGWNLRASEDERQAVRSSRPVRLESSGCKGKLWANAIVIVEGDRIVIVTDRVLRTIGAPRH